MNLARRIFIFAMGVATVAAGSLWPSTPTTAATATSCAQKAAYAGTTIVWTGHGDGHSWSDRSNWKPAVVPDATRRVGTYAADYVCIGKNRNGKSADVQIAKGKYAHIAGLDLSDGAKLTVVQSRLFLGSAPGDPVVPSYVGKHSQLEILASAFGGNSPLHVSGTMRLTAKLAGRHKRPATMTSSECVFAPTKRCSASTIKPGGGRTIVARSGHLLVDGSGYGGAILGDERAVDNFGTLRFRHDGYLAMDDGTSLVDEPSSALVFDGPGGIYRGASAHRQAVATVDLAGAISKKSSATSVVGVPAALSGKPKVMVRGGDLVLDAARLPTASVHRGAGYGSGSCTYSVNHPVLCRATAASPVTPQTAVVQTSQESVAPSVSKIGVALTKSSKRLHGHRELGKAIDVKAPTKRTTASTHLTFSFNSTLNGVPSPSQARVYRGKHLITRCAVHGLTATNRSCLFSAKTEPSHAGKGSRNLTLFVISIEPKGRWRVT